MEKQILDKLNNIFEEYESLVKQNQQIVDFSDVKKITNLKRRIKKLEPTYQEFAKWKSYTVEIEEIENLLKTETDKEVLKEFKKALLIYKKELEETEKNIKELLIEKDAFDDNDVMFEIKGAVGGDEANIFVGDLFDMYKKYALKNKYQVIIEEEIESEAGGYSLLSFSVDGLGAYGKFKFESGVHRVQRIPSTESRGRVHTSTVTVSVFPKTSDDEELKILDSDIRIDTYRSSGAGGQHVNKTDSAVRVTHIPTGIVVSSQKGRSQHDNKAKALETLKSKLLKLKIDQESEKQNESKKQLIGSGERSEKIRTYNYPQNRITDHRINLTIKKLDQIMEGNLNEIIDVLISTYYEN